MIGERIKELRTQNGMTQKQLADKLFVTAQAVSRWEKNEVEPSLGALTEMARLFEVTVDELITGDEIKKESFTVEEIVEETVAQVEAKPVLAVCEQCNKPIYDGNEIVRIDYPTKKIICKNCDTDNKERRLKSYIAQGIVCRRRSFIWSPIISALLLVISLVITFSNVKNATLIGVTGCVASVLCFPFLSCLFLKNNFIGDVVETVSLWGFVKFPGLIFELSLDGIVWLLTVKLLFWILGIILAAFFWVLAIAFGMALSVFVYPFALIKNIRHPEIWEDD